MLDSFNFFLLFDKLINCTFIKFFSSLEDSIGKPLFVMFRNLTQFTEDDSRRLQLFSLLAEMRTHQTRIGYLLLYYLQVSSLINNNSDRKTNK